MPKQGLQMEEGTITKWLVAEGGRCEAGKPLFEMETDKLTITIDAPASGVLTKILRGEGETIPITETIAIIGEGAVINKTYGPEKRLFITPRAKRAAAAAGVDTSALCGTGGGGLIIERDVFNAAQKTKPDPKNDSAPAPRGINIDADMSEVLRLCEKLKDAGEKTSYDDIVGRASACAGKRYPVINDANMEEYMEYMKTLLENPCLMLAI